MKASYEFDESKYPKIFTERLIDLSNQPYIEINGILHNWHPSLGNTFYHIYRSLFDMAFNTGLPVITGHQKPISEETDQEWFIPINESSNLMDKTRLTIGDIYELQWDEGMWIVQLTNLSDLMFTCMCCDKTSPDYGKEPTLSISYCHDHGVRMRNRHCSKHNESIGRSFTTYSQKEDMKMPEKSIIIKQKDPEKTPGIRPVAHYEFDPEYFYKLCAFTVIDLRSDPVTRYECILIETNPTHLVFAAFDGEKDYSGRQEFKNIKRLTVNMDRYLAGEFQLIRHAWECKNDI